VRLRRVHLVRFMQFIDQVLEVDPRVTVLVGRNDVGKTTILRWFFDQHVKERVIHGRARPLIKGHEADPISFRLLWETEERDRDRYPLKEAFGREDVRRIEIGFRHETPGGKDYWITADGKPVDVYKPNPKSPDQWVMKEVYASRRLFPVPYYLSLGDKQIMPSMFEARFYDLTGSVEALFVRELIPTEELLLRLAGLNAQTRHSSGSGVDEPWGGVSLPRSAATLDEIEQRLERVSQQLSGLVAEWWQDPRGLRIDVRIGGPRSAREYQNNRNSYGITWQIVDSDGIATTEQASNGSLPWSWNFYGSKPRLASF
jgi:AAA domain-containing protein